MRKMPNYQYYKNTPFHPPQSRVPLGVFSIYFYNMIIYSKHCRKIIEIKVFHEVLYC